MDTKWLTVAVRLFGGPLVAAVLSALLTAGVVAPEAVQQACARALGEFASNSSTLPPRR